MAMERFFPADFHPRANFPQVEDTSLPESWPINYEDLQPYYEAAERLYRLRGSPDPLRTDAESVYLAPPLPLSPGNQELYDFLQRKGLHPYCLPLAYEGVPDCPGCQCYLCPKPCKNDSSRICLEPALKDYGAGLLDQCSVLRLEADKGRLTGVICSWQGKTITLRSELVVLAAGALQTPALLLRSASPVWPNGLANESGLVGRNLMRHCVDLYAVFVNNPPYRGNVKEIAFNDCYHADGYKLGSVQSFGILPPAPMIVEQMQQDLRDGRWPPAAVFLGLIKPLLRSVFSRLFARTLILATVMEDIPHPENQVLSEDGRVVLQYRLHPYDRERIALFRQKMRAILQPYRFILLKQAENNDRIAHACGTCRFGVDARDSVLNPMNRTHSISNLYVTDASFFPSSAGINPSLTIAANALRVADGILGHKMGGQFQPIDSEKSTPPQNR